MEKDQQRLKKRRILELVQTGHSLQEACTAEGIHMCRSTAYRLRREVQARGEIALHDGRHGHPAKLCEAVRQWLVTTCCAAPQMPSRELRTALQEQFSIRVSIGHLNRVRAELHVANRVGRQKKNTTFHLLRMNFSGKKVQVDCFLLPPHTRRSFYQH